MIPVKTLRPPPSLHCCPPHPPPAGGRVMNYYESGSEDEALTPSYVSTQPREGLVRNQGA